MTNVTATITARDNNTCIGTMGSVDADITINGRHIAGVTLAAAKCTGTLYAVGGSTHDWIDNVDAVVSAAAQQAAGGFIDPAHGLDAATEIMLDAIVDAVRGAA